MKYAHIENGIVINISNWDGETEYNPGEGITLIQADENAYVGGEYNGSFVARPVEPDPEPTAEEIQKAADKQSAHDKLSALGLTDAEIEAIT